MITADHDDIKTTAVPSSLLSSSSKPRKENRNVSSSPTKHSRSRSSSHVRSSSADVKLPKQKHLYKTVLCKQFMDTGECKFGERCHFAHGDVELRPPVKHPKYKTEKCRMFHETGLCPYGKECSFKHDEEDTSVNEVEDTSPVSNESKEAVSPMESENPWETGALSLGLADFSSLSKAYNTNVRNDAATIRKLAENSRKDRTNNASSKSRDYIYAMMALEADSSLNDDSSLTQDVASISGDESLQQSDSPAVVVDATATNGRKKVPSRKLDFLNRSVSNDQIKEPKESSSSSKWSWSDFQLKNKEESVISPPRKVVKSNKEFFSSIREVMLPSSSNHRRISSEPRFM